MASGSVVIIHALRKRRLGSSNKLRRQQQKLPEEDNEKEKGELRRSAALKCITARYLAGIRYKAAVFCLFGGKVNSRLMPLLNQPQ